MNSGSCSQISSSCNCPIVRDGEFSGQATFRLFQKRLIIGTSMFTETSNDRRELKRKKLACLSNTLECSRSSLSASPRKRTIKFPDAAKLINRDL